MSSLGSSTEVVFNFRAGREKLRDDLRDTERQVKDAAKNAVQAATFEFAKLPPIRFTIDDNQFRKQLADMTKQLHQAATAAEQGHKFQNELSKGLKPDNLDAEARERFKSTADNPLNAAKEGGEGFLGATHEIHRTLGKAFQAVVLIDTAMQAVAVTSSGVNLISAAITGNYEGQVKAAKEAEDSIKAIPVVGDKILDLGRLINKYTIDLVTHEQEYVDKIKKATEEQDKHTASLAKRAKQQQDNIANAKQISESVGQADNPNESQEAAASRKVREERQKLKDAMMGDGLRGKGGKLNATGQAIQNEGNKRVANAELAQEKITEESHKQSYARMAVIQLRMSNETAKADRAEFLETQRQKVTAAMKVGSDAVANTKVENQIALAAYDEQQRKKREGEQRDLSFANDQTRRGISQDTFGAKQAGTAKQFDDQIRGEKDVTKVKLLEEGKRLALNANVVEETRRIAEKGYAVQSDSYQRILKTAGFTYQADLVAYKATADAKIRAATTQQEKELAIREKTEGLAAMQAQRTKETVDINFATRQATRRRKGGGQQADVFDIEYKAEQAIKAATGDSGRQKALVDQAMEDVRGLKPQAQQAEVVSGASALRANLLGGSPQDKLTQIQTQALAYLKAISDKVGPARTG